MCDVTNDESIYTDTPGDAARLHRRLAAFDEGLEQLAAAPPFAKARYQTQVFRLATDLMSSGKEGMRLLFERAGRFDEAGVFRGGPWEDPQRLVPELVGAGLKGEGVYPTVEALSELRMLAIAAGRCSRPDMTSDQARQFLREICAKNLDLMFPETSEETRRRPAVFARAERLFDVICSKISIEGLKKTVFEEIELICAQRPIQTKRVVKLLDRAGQLPGSDVSKIEQRLEFYKNAIGRASPASQRADDPIAYRRILKDLSDEELLEEGAAFAESLTKTGLGSPYHAVLLRRLARKSFDLIASALGLSDSGRAECQKNSELTSQLIRVAVFPDTAEAIYGLSGVLERGLLSRSEVAGGLRRLIDLDILPEVADTLLSLVPQGAGLTANSILTSGAVSVLGQPLGIGQGNNPTCQAARGISLWSLHAPGMLLGMVANAARDGLVETKFEGTLVRTNELAHGLMAPATKLDVDPVSSVLVPHLDRLYNRMMELASLRGEDGHKWVNPAMYGRWVPNGFASAINPLTQRVEKHTDFVRRFYATHHPEYNDGHELIYPNPVGIMVTDVHGNLLGPHAVSIQRIAKDPNGELRIYFYNPNNEGRQDWGLGVRPRVKGRGEIHGESSLPFGHFISRLYAFHFDPYEEGDAFAVPTDTIAEVSAMAEESWGRAYNWLG